jgi:hypothetical protein
LYIRLALLFCVISILRTDEKGENINEDKENEKRDKKEIEKNLEQCICN